jgi:hypothetical protein
MNIFDICLLSAFVAFGVFGFVRCLSNLKNNNLEFLPTLGWLLTMALPFLIEWSFLHPNLKYVQLMGVGIFAIVFLAGDEIAASIRIAKDKAAPATTLEINARALKTTYIFLSISVVIMAVHLATSANIPLIELLKSNDDTVAVADRYNYYRNLPLGVWFTYVVNFNLYLFMAPAIVYLIHRRKYAIAGAALLIAIAYALSGTAKAQCVMIVAQIFVMSMFLHYNRGTTMYRLFWTMIVMLLMLAGYYITNMDRTSLHSPISNAAPKNTSVNHIGDYYRAAQVPESAQPSLTERADRKAQHFFYRSILTPVEVSARWYEYFYLYPVMKGTFSQNVMDSRSQKSEQPSNVVGKWAYHERFPTHYYDSIHAYSSIDADSFARFGVFGWFIAGILYLAVRIGMAAIYDPRSPVQAIMYGTTLILIGGMTASASIQALLLPNGLIACVAIMLILTIVERRQYA